MNVVNVLFYKCNLPPEVFKELLANIWRAEPNSMIRNFIVLIVKETRL